MQKFIKNGPEAQNKKINGPKYIIGHTMSMSYHMHIYIPTAVYTIFPMDIINLYNSVKFL